MRPWGLGTLRRRAACGYGDGDGSYGIASTKAYPLFHLLDSGHPIGLLAHRTCDCVDVSAGRIGGFMDCSLSAEGTIRGSGIFCLWR